MKNISLACYDSGLEIDADCHTNNIIYCQLVGNDYKTMSRDVFIRQCSQAILTQQRAINDIARILQVYDSEYWSKHTIAIVPIARPTYFRRIFSFLRMNCFGIIRYLFGPWCVSFFLLIFVNHFSIYLLFKKNFFFFKYFSGCPLYKDQKVD